MNNELEAFKKLIMKAEQAGAWLDDTLPGSDQYERAKELAQAIKDAKSALARLSS